MTANIIKYIYSFIFITTLYFTQSLVFGQSKKTTIHKAQSEKGVQINVRFNDAHPLDTLSLLFYDDLYLPVIESYDQYKQFDAVIKNDGVASFKFSLPSNLGYIAIVKKSKEGRQFKFDVLFPLSIVEYGDSITINIVQKDLLKHIRAFNNLEYNFSGKGINKYILRKRLDSLSKKTVSSVPIYDQDFNFSPDNNWDSNIRAQLNELDKHRTEISWNAYERLRADILYDNKKKIKYVMLWNYYETDIKKRDSVSIKKFRQGYNTMIVNDLAIIPEQTAIHTKGYAEIVYRKEFATNFINNGHIDNGQLFYTIKNNYTGKIRDKLIVLYFYFLNGDSTFHQYTNLLRDALQFVSKPYYNDLTKFVIRETGHKAYNFNLPDIENNKRNLSEFKGKVVFIDFWFTGCGSCSDYYINELSKVEANFKNNKDYVFVSVSVDRDVNLWKKSIAEGQYTSPDVINLYTNGLGYHHQIINKYNIYGYPHPMIIDKHGNMFEFKSADLRKKDSLIKALLDAEKK